MTANVKYFHDGMTGAPQMDTAQGDLYNVIKACLVTGFNIKSIDSITRTGAVATATISAGHGNEVGQWLLIEGAAQTEYNGEHQILSVTANQFTFAVTGTPVTPATGTISCRVAPLDFEEVYSGTYKGVFRSRNVLGPRLLLRLDNQDPATEWSSGYGRIAKVTMADTMSGVDDFSGIRTPYRVDDTTRNERGAGWLKWHQARVQFSRLAGGVGTVGPRRWKLIGDDRGFYFFHGANAYSGSDGWRFPQVAAFQEFASFKSADAYNTLLLGTEISGDVSVGVPGTPYSQQGQVSGTQFAGSRCLRDYTGMVDTRMSMCSLATGVSECISGYSTGIPYPNGPDFSLIIHPIYLREESSTSLRGVLPGYYAIHNNWGAGYDRQILDNVEGYPGRKFLVSANALDGGSAVRVAIDLTGPWR